MSVDLNKWIKVSVCQCCLLIAANGEACGTDDCQSCQRYDRPENEGYYLTASFVDDCTDDCQHERCGHGEGYFSWSACDWCNVSLGGQRYDVWAEDRRIGHGGQ